MRPQLPHDQFQLGVDRGDYVPLGFEEFRHGYDVFSAALADELRRKLAATVEPSDGRQH